MNTNIINISVLPNLEGKPTDDQYIFSTDSEEESFKIQAKGLVFKDSTGKIKKEDLPEKKYTPKELYEAGQPFFFYLETLDGKRIYYNTNKFVPEEEKVETLENIKNIWQQVFFTDGINLYNPNKENIFDYGRTDDIAQNAIKFTSDDTIVLCGLYGVESGIEGDDVKETYWKFIEGTGFQIGVEKVEYRVKISPIPLYNRGSIILSVFPMEIELDSNYFESDDASAFGLWDINTDSSIAPQNDIYGSFNNIILRNTGISLINNIYLKQKFITLGRTITDKYSYEALTDKPTLNVTRSDGRRGNREKLLSFAYLINKSSPLNTDIVQKIVNTGIALSEKDSFYTCVSKNIPFGCRLQGYNSDVIIQTKATDNYLTYLESLGIPVIRNKEINSKDFVIVNSSIYSLDSDTYLACIKRENSPIALCWSHYIDEKKLSKDTCLVPYQFLFQEKFNSNNSTFGKIYFNFSPYRVKTRINTQGFLEKEGDSQDLYNEVYITEKAVITSNPEYISIYPVGFWNSGLAGNMGYSVYSPIGLSSSLLDYRYNEDPKLFDYNGVKSISSNFENIPAFKPFTVLVRSKHDEVDAGYGNKWNFNVVNRDQKYENNTPLFFFYPGQAQASHYKKLGRLKVVKDENYNYSLVKEIIPIEEAEPYIAYFEVTPELEKEILGGKPFTQREILDLLKEEKPAIFALKTLDGKYIDSTTGGVTEDTEVDDPDHPGQKIKNPKNSCFIWNNYELASFSNREVLCRKKDGSIKFEFDLESNIEIINVFIEDGKVIFQNVSKKYLNWSVDNKWTLSNTKQVFIVEPTVFRKKTNGYPAFSLSCPIQLRSDKEIDITIKAIKNINKTSSFLDKITFDIPKDTPVIASYPSTIPEYVDLTPVHSNLEPIKTGLMGFYSPTTIKELELKNIDFYSMNIDSSTKRISLNKLIGWSYPFMAGLDFCREDGASFQTQVMTLSQTEYNNLREDEKNLNYRVYLVYEDTTPTPGA